MNYLKAREIMIGNFFGPEEWKNFYGIDLLSNNLSPKAIYAISHFPWDEKILNSFGPDYYGSSGYYGKDKSSYHEKELIRENHFAFLSIPEFNNVPLTVNKWTEIEPGLICKIDWGKELKFLSQNTCELGWHLILIDPMYVCGSSAWARAYSCMYGNTKNFPNYKLASAIEETTKLILYHKLKRSFPKVRPFFCSDWIYKDEDKHERYICGVHHYAKAEIICVPKGRPPDEGKISVSWNCPHEPGRMTDHVSASRLQPKPIPGGNENEKY